jgi:hypothetical protein
MTPSIFDWIEFLPRGIRNSWCELTGGHDNVVLGCWQKENFATQISLHCQRCQKQTRWYSVPLKNDPSRFSVIQANLNGGEHDDTA